MGGAFVICGGSMCLRAYWCVCVCVCVWVCGCVCGLVPVNCASHDYSQNRHGCTSTLSGQSSTVPTKMRSLKEDWMRKSSLRNQPERLVQVHTPQKHTVVQAHT